MVSILRNPEWKLFLSFPVSLTPVWSPSSNVFWNWTFSFFYYLILFYISSFILLILIDYLRLANLFFNELERLITIFAFYLSNFLIFYILFSSFLGCCSCGRKFGRLNTSLQTTVVKDHPVREYASTRTRNRWCVQSWRTYPCWMGSGICKS